MFVLNLDFIEKGLASGLAKDNAATTESFETLRFCAMVTPSSPSISNGDK
jgi:hypothetical protein